MEQGRGLSPEVSNDQKYGELYGRDSNLYLRWRAYETVPGNSDFKTSMYDAMDLNGAEVLVDVGCNEAHDLVSLRQRGHHGKLIGVEAAKQLVHHVSEQSEVKAADIQVLPGEAEKLPFKDESVDCITAMFMLYHTPNPQAAIEEMHRVLKPGGRLAIATSSERNKLRHRQFERDISGHLRIGIPERYNHKFSTGHLEQYLGELIAINGEQSLHRSRLPLFETVTYYRQNDFMRFDTSNYHHYTGSLATMFNRSMVFSRYWSEALHKIVLPQIEGEIADSGDFRDVSDRSWAVFAKRSAPDVKHMASFILNQQDAQMPGAA